MVENQQAATKIGVNPARKGLNITELLKLKEKIPEVAEYLSVGMWNRKSLEGLFENAQKS